MSTSGQLPIDAFPAWAHLNHVSFKNIKLQHVGGERGFGLLADSAITGDSQDNVVLRVPHDLVLSAEAIDDYAKVDQNFKQLLEVLGRRPSRFNVMLYLLVHLAQSRSPMLKGLSHTPWTEYIRFLPRSIPIPTMWTEPERLLLNGTSLEAALDAKLAALDHEFDELRATSSDLPFWNDLLWERQAVSFEDWILADAWYRSRCLELPHSGSAMVPTLDMVNHSGNANALYEENDTSISNDVVLLIRPGSGVSQNDEVTISYGEAKPASEMFFSYGFIDPSSPICKMTLHLSPFPDDPLSKAKLHIFPGLPTLTLSLRTITGEERRGENKPPAEWHSPFVYLMCLNEEDGLSFQILQDSTGGRELRVLWQGEDATDRAADFETLIEGHELYQVFRLRAVTVLHQMVEEQLASIHSGPSEGQLEPLQAAGILRAECVTAAKTLKEVESKLLSSALETLEQQKNELLADDHVVAYLGSKEVYPIGQAQQALLDNPSNQDDDDFS